MTMHDDELTPAERAAFEALPRERAPRAELEELTMEALRARGALRPDVRSPSARTKRWIGAAVAAALLFSGGLAAGYAIATQRAVVAQRDSLRANDLASVTDTSFNVHTDSASSARSVVWF